MLIIDFEILKPKLYDYFLSRYYIADSKDDLLQHNNWAMLWEKKKMLFTNQSYADFDVFAYLFKDDLVNLQYLTWNKSIFGAIQPFYQCLNELYINPQIRRKDMSSEIQKSRLENNKIYLFEFSPIDTSTKRSDFLKK